MVRFSVLVFPDNVVLAGLVMDYGLGAATLMAKTSGELIWLVTQDWPCNTTVSWDQESRVPRGTLIPLKTHYEI